MTTHLLPTTAAYVNSINGQDRSAFHSLFAEGAVVNDAGREYHGHAEIRAWSDREIFDALVTLRVIDSYEQDGETVLTTEVDGNFDRTGLPDQVIINHHIRTTAEGIVSLTCRLAVEVPQE